MDHRYMIHLGSSLELSHRYPRISSQYRGGLMSANPLASAAGTERRTFIGGSDARIIMGSEESGLLRLWREKRGEAEPEDLSDNLIVQLGVATEDLNRR